MSHAGDPQFGMRGWQRVFICCENFLIQFFAPAKSGKDDLDIVLAETGVVCHIACKVRDFDGLAHIKHDDFTAFAGQAGLQHQLDSLGDRHEKSRNFRVGHRDGPASCNLLHKFGDHAAGGPEYVAETDNHKLRATLATAAALKL
jgi:hypothetical protein